MEATEGRWSALTATPGMFAVHGILLDNGRVLLFSGSVESSELPTVTFDWDPGTAFASAEQAPMAPGTDLFCAHHVVLEDGTVLVAGGSGEFNSNYVGDWGIKSICVYDRSKALGERWQEIGAMREGRWYPTLVTLADGTLAIFSGIIRGNTHAATAEYFAPPFEGPGYTTDAVSGGDKSFPSYPGMLLVKGGKVVHVGTTWQYRGSGTTAPIGTFSFRKTGPTTGVWVDEGVAPEVAKREEGTFVLLPPAQDGRILLLGGGDIDGSAQASDAEIKSAEILHTQESPMRWERLADMNHPRVNVSAVLLPDAKVLVLGGHDSYKWSAGRTPSNQAEIYDPVLGSDPSAWQPVATMSEPRQYHSSALLLPDGRVLTAGGVANDNGNQFSLEFYEPPYMFKGDRPDLVDAYATDGPAGEIAYGGVLVIETPQAAAIRKIALMRPGSMTHHTDTEQRYVALESFLVEGTDRLRVGVVNDPSVAPPGFYMLWIVDDQNRPCKVAKFLRLSARRCRLITDRSHVSKDELNSSGSTTFNDAFYVIFDGFVPSTLGVTTPSPTTAELETISPAISFTSGSGEFVRDYPEIVAVPQELLLEDDTLPAGVRQKVTFKFALRFDSGSPFEDPGGMPIELQNLDVHVQKNGYTCGGDLTLTNQPNPYMVDGATHWLSTDVRVFQISEGDSRFLETMGDSAAAANAFIQAVLARFRADNGYANTQFETITTDQSTSALELARMKDGKRVFNFAIAKVRYRGQTLNATDVRVFFRMFTTAATGMEYSVGSTYRRGLNPGGDPVPLLGMRGGELVTIPFFAEPRVDSTLHALTDQVDDVNRRTLSAGGGAEVTEFFGCFLDFNQTTLRFPTAPGGDGPFAAGLRSIQELIRGRHQCLIAEVRFDPDPILDGQTPASNDNLSQRNLIIVESDNPGSAASHTVEHTLEIQATRNVGVGVAAVIPEFVIENQHGDHEHHHFPKDLVRGEHDELMIQWGNLPRSAQARLYVPGLRAADAVFLTNQKIGPHRLEVVDEHTLGLLIGDVTYVTLPPSPTQSVPALLTVELPDNVKRGQRFDVTIDQIDGESRRIVGGFHFMISVSTAAMVLPNEARTLSVFKHIAATIPVGDLWRPIFDRMLQGLGDKVRALGGDPDAIAGSPDGDGGATTPGPLSAGRELTPHCLLLGLGLAMLFGLAVAAIAHVNWWFGVLALAVVTALGVGWAKRCRVPTGLLLAFLALALLAGITWLELLR